MLRWVIVLVGILGCSTFLHAQEILRSHTTLLGIGNSNQLDTYLSPYEYTGSELRFVQENIKPTRMLQGRVSMQNLIQTHYAYTQSPSHEGNYLSGMVSWSIGGHYNWQLHSSWQVAVGPQLHTYVGGIYNTHSGNNPAQLRADIQLNASARASYQFPFLRRMCKCSYQGDFMLMGACFSPQYGESYYEIFTLNNGGSHNICFTSPFKAVCYRQMVRFILPFKSWALNVGILSDVQQNKVSSLKNHNWSNLFIIGYTKQFQLIPCK